jgi:hypothetical protein
MSRALVALLAAGLLTVAAGCAPGTDQAIRDLASSLPSFDAPSDLPPPTAAGDMPWPAPAHITGRLEQVDSGADEEQSWRFVFSVDVQLEIDSSRSDSEQVRYTDAGSTWTLSGSMDSTAESKVCHGEGNGSGSFPDDSLHLFHASLESSLTGWGLLFEAGNSVIPGRMTCDGVTHDTVWDERVSCQAEWVDANTFKADGYCDAPPQFVVTGTLTGN